MRTRKMLAVFAAIIVFFAAQNVLAQSDLVVHGNVLGYQLYRIQSTTLPQMNTLLFKINKVVEGKERSEFILIKFWKESLDTDYARENFGLSRTSRFSLERQKFCDEKVKRFTGKGLPNGDNAFVGYSEIFRLMPSVDLNSLPISKRLPCYLESRSEG